MGQEYISVKRSQISFFQKIQLYYFSKDGKPLIYKKKGVTLEKSRIQLDKYPELFIHRSDKEGASKELLKALNFSLAKAVSSKGLVKMKTILCDIVEEALSNPSNSSLDSLPETLEILFRGYSEDKALLDALTRVSTHSSMIVNHTVNILSLTMQYCFFNNLSESDTKRLGICALLHDIGSMEIEKEIIEADYRLTDKEFQRFKTHTARGYRIIRSKTNFDMEVALVALEHHEKLDGSGYPKGKTKLSEASQLIGLIDSYEPLTYKKTKFRQPQKPFNSLQILKKEVMEGKYNKKMFVSLCSALVR